MKRTALSGLVLTPCESEPSKNAAKLPRWRRDGSMGRAEAGGLVGEGDTVYWWQGVGVLKQGKLPCVLLGLGQLELLLNHRVYLLRKSLICRLVV